MQDFRNTLKLIDGPARRALVWLVALGFVVAGLEFISAALVFLLVGLVGDPRMVATSRLLMPFRAMLPNPTEDALLVSVAAGTAILSLLKNGLSVVQTRASTFWVQRGLDRMSTRVLRGYLAADYSFHLHRDSASLIQNINGAVYTVFQTLLAGLTSAFFETMMVLALGTVLVIKAPLVCLAMLAALGVGVGATLRITQRRFNSMGRQVHMLHQDAYQTLRDAFGGIRDVKLFAQEDVYLRKFTDVRTRLSSVQVERTVYDAAPRIVVEAIFITGLVILVIVSSVWIKLPGPGLVPLLGLLGYAGLRLLPSIHRLVFYVAQMRLGRASLAIVTADLARLDRDVPERPAGDATAIPFEREIAAEAVSFSYPESDRPILRSVDLRIARGEFVGVVGATAAGKSTLVDLLLGLHRPTAGRITIDGVDIAGHERGWQRRVGCVPQAPYLLDASLAQNIALPDGQPPDRARLDRAVASAQLDGLVRTLPDGLDSVIGERGVRLSGGERQRIAFARALYREPEVLVLDEATSSLDHDTERAIADALEVVRGSKTIIVVAHRMKTVERCNRLFFLVDGAIADVGSYAELLARNSAFRTMVQAPAAERG